jgi:hypothetical protein
MGDDKPSKILPEEEIKKLKKISDKIRKIAKKYNVAVFLVPEKKVSSDKELV